MKSIRLMGALGGALLLIAGGTAMASVAIRNFVQGTVESADSRQITINGTSYPLTESQQKALGDASSLVGKSVEILLTSPAGSKGAQVMEITPAAAKQ